jgi:hypothetical protein
MIELLAVTDDPSPPPPPLRAVPVDGLSVLCAPARPEPVTREALWQREATLEALMGERTVLPIRYGTFVADEAAAAGAVAPRCAALRAGLERVRGAVELSVRVHADAPAPDTGARYLSRAREARDVHEPLAALARAAVLRPTRELLRAAYLVDRGSVGAFVAEVERLQRERPDLAILATGPWPPYSFAAEHA